jgi:hypothetical protein
MYLSYEEWAAMPDTPERLALRAGLTAERKREEAALAARQSRTAEAYARAEGADSAEAGMAILREHSAELLAEHLAKTGLCPAAA